MKITIVGTGYVGLVTGVCFAEVGIHVTCVDIDEKKISLLQQGKSPIYEPGLEDMLNRNLSKKRIFFTSRLSEALKECDIIFIAVGTPQDEDGSADLSYVLKVASEIGQLMEKSLLVVTKSTVPVGTSSKIREVIRKELEKRNRNIPFYVASNPEFLKEGAAIEDFMKPDRIIIGVNDKVSEDLLQKLYHPFVLNGHPVIVMDVASAELTKYAANAMLATKISFMNEMANLCEYLGADINMVRKGIGSDPRIGNKFIYPGIGYGGSCFPKDVKAIIRTAGEQGYRLRILESVDYVNQEQKKVLPQKVIRYFGGNVKGLRFGLWGLSFKPKTDDMREAPSLDIIRILTEAGAEIYAYDPVAMPQAATILSNQKNFYLVQDMYACADEADALLLATEWPEFRSPDWKDLAQRMKRKLIFDGRNIYEREVLEEAGFEYYCIGSNTVKNRKI